MTNLEKAVLVFFALFVFRADTSLANSQDDKSLQEMRRMVSAHYNSTSDLGSSPCDGVTASDSKQQCLAVELCYKEKMGLSQAVASYEVQLLCDTLDLDQKDSLGGRSDEVVMAEDDGGDHSKKPSSASVWGYGILCVTIISAMSVMGAGVLPFMSKSFYSSLLTTLIGLAVGSLSGSALFHLVPSAFGLADVDAFAHHSYLNVSIVVWFGVYGFFVIERLLKIFMDIKSRKQGFPTHSHLADRDRGDGKTNNHNQEATDPILSKSDDAEGGAAVNGGKDGGNADVEAKNCNKEVHFKDGSSSPSGCVAMASSEVYEQSKPAMRASFGHMERPAHPDNRPTVDKVSKSLESSHSAIATVAWMIIFGDGVHNFIDGLSIGAAFSESILTGISVSVAVLCEEFPHELGDFAVLLNSGMTMRQAMSYNFLSACTCYLGLVIGILLGELHMANQYIFALAGGMFLYIALVDMVPELNETVDNASKSAKGNDDGDTTSSREESAYAGVRRSLGIFALQNLGINIGIVSLFILAKFQDDIQISL